MATMEKTSKLVGILGLLFISALILDPPATQYEPSIIGATHPVPIALFVVLVSVGVSLLVVSAVTRGDTLRSGLFALFFAFLGFFILPSARGYHLYGTFGADALSHLGIVLDTLETGHLSDARYAATHTLYAELSLVLSVEPAALSDFVPFIFFLLLVTFLALLARALGAERRTMIFTILLSISLPFGVYHLTLMPWLFALTLLPVALLCTHRHATRSGWCWGAGGLITITSATFYHPISAGFIIIAICGYFAARYVHTPQHANWQTALNFVAIGGLLLTTWTVLQGRLGGHIHGLFVRLLSAESGGAARASEAGISEYTLWQIILEFFLPEAGVLTVLFACGGVVAIGLLYNHITQDPSLLESFAVTHYMIGSALGLLFLVVQIHGTNFARSGQYLVLFSIITAAIGMAVIFRRLDRAPERRTTVVSGTVAIFLVVLILFGGTMAYNNPSEMTETAMDGHGWLIDHKTPSHPIISGMGRDRFAWYHLGYAEAQSRFVEETVATSHQLSNRIAEETSGTSAVEEGYLVTREAEISRYETEPDWRLNNMNHYTEGDVDRLHRTPTAGNIYSNGDYKAWVLTEQRTSEPAS